MANIVRKFWYVQSKHPIHKTCKIYTARFEGNTPIEKPKLLAAKLDKETAENEIFLLERKVKTIYSYKK